MSARIRYIGKSVENIRGEGKREEVVLPHLSVSQIRAFKPILDFLNLKDLDILYLIFVSQKKQTDVREILGRTQSSLAYDVKRIRHRLRFIYYLQEVYDTAIGFLTGEDAKSLFTSDEISILVLMFYTSSFSLTAKLIGIYPARVRRVYNRCLEVFREEEMWECYEIFSIIRANLNIVKRLYSGSKVGRPRKSGK